MQLIAGLSSGMGLHADRERSSLLFDPPSPDRHRVDEEQSLILI